MKIHEYQAKEVLARFGVPILNGKVATTVDEAVQIAGELGGEAWVVKAQIHAGGRGKGGGVKVARGSTELRRLAGEILAMTLVTPQTGPGGQIVRKIFIEEACDIAAEFYVGIVIDRKLGLPVLMASSEGGVEIEEVAARSPEKILRQPLDPRAGLLAHQGRVLARKLGLSGAAIARCAKVMTGLARAFLDTDASLGEINPMVLTAEGRVIALDAKFSFDDNALYRHGDIAAYRDIDEEDPREARAAELDLSYIKLSGTIGCMVNGAGLAMATMDIIKHNGGEPANFLDVGGGATADRVTEAFKILLDDEDVRAVLVNIFGGIMKCDVIAEGIVAAAREVAPKVPIVVRLEGTNVEKGKEILEASGLKLIAADGLAEAAQRVVAEAREMVS